MNRALHPLGLALLTVLASAGPASTLTAEPADLPALERGSQPNRERNALDECKPREDAYVAALMAARSDADLPLGG